MIAGGWRIWNDHRALATTTAVLAAGGYSVGASRPFDYDSAVTVHNFVVTPSILDALTREVVLNNHPFFSLLEHVVFSVTGSADEMTMRVLPIVCAVAAIGLLTLVLAQRLGPLPALAGTAVLATNPLFLTYARAVRGYSLLTLAAVASTVLLLRLKRDDHRLSALAYVATVAAGAGTNPYMALVVAGHGLYLLLERALTWRWLVRWSLGLSLGAAFHLVNITTTLRTVRGRGRSYRPNFPRDLGREVLGGETVAIALVVSLLVVACWLCPRKLTLAGLAIAFSGVFVLLWQVWAPLDFHTRLFIWLTPAVALGVAFAVARWRPLALLAFAAAAVSLFPLLDGYTVGQLGNRTARDVLGDANTAQVCSLSYQTEALRVYLPNVRQVDDPAALDACEAVVDLVTTTGEHVELREAAALRFRRQVVLRGRDYSGLLFLDPVAPGTLLVEHADAASGESSR